MSTKDSEALEQQRQRRNRINRMKTGIIVTITVWMLVSLLAIILLTVQVARLSSHVKRLEKAGQTTVSQNIPDSENVQAADTESSGQETQKSAYDKVVTGIDSGDNMAKAGDAHKVYLTFDGGPDENTDKILDVLDKYGVKATFFVVGDDSKDMQEVYKRIVKDGHTLGMHSYSNKYSQIYQSDEAFEEDFERLRDELHQVTGVNSIYYRFPGGSSNQISNVPMSDFIHYLNEQGVIYYDWNVSAGDAASNAYSSEEIVANVMDDVVKYKTSVVLLHDASDKSATVEALAPLIEALNEMGAEILPIDEDTSVIQYVKADSID